jgi:hypothetical protein
VKKATAKKATVAQRERYKVSPVRRMAVDAWIGKFTKDWQSETVRAIVKLVHDSAPDATVSIKWGQPVFEHHGPFAFIKPAKAHVSFGFWRGAEVADPKGLLTRGDRMGHVKLRSHADLDTAAFAAMIEDAVRLNRQKGSPTKR